jgi:hypothetical protein
MPKPKGREIAAGKAIFMETAKRLPSRRKEKIAFCHSLKPF